MSAHLIDIDFISTIMSGSNNPYESRPNVPASYHCSTALQSSSFSDGGEGSGSDGPFTFGLVRLDISQRDNPVNYTRYMRGNPANNPVNNYPANNPVNNYPANNPVSNYPANNPINPSEDEAIELPRHLTDVGDETHAGPPAPFVTAALQVLGGAVNRSTSTTHGVDAPPILDMIDPITLATSRLAVQKQTTMVHSYFRPAVGGRTLSFTTTPWHDKDHPMDMQPSSEELDVLITRYPALLHRSSEFTRLTRREIKAIRLHPARCVRRMRGLNTMRRYTRYKYALELGDILRHCICI